MASAGSPQISGKCRDFDLPVLTGCQVRLTSSMPAAAEISVGTGVTVILKLHVKGVPL